MNQPAQRLQALDALRGMAALVVVCFHYIPYYDKLYGHGFTPWSVLSFGRYGVHLFFMLSGFVIFMTLERTSTAGWFGLARAFRLLPALWAGIVVTFVSVHLLGPDDRAVSFVDALLNVTLLHEYLERPHVDGAYWSLVVEATFYVWMALLFYTLGNGRALRAVFWVWVLVSYAAVMMWKAIPDDYEFLVKDLLFTRYAPLFVSGMLIYQWHRYRRLPWPDLLLLALAIGHCLVAYKAPFSVFVLGCYGIFVLAVSGRLNRLANRPLLWLGSISYALYLVHQNIGYGVIHWSYAAGLPGWVGIALAFGVALVLATAIQRWIEQPALRWFRLKRQSQVAKTAMTS
ncbi:acyltransferase family protein [Marinobacter caseinilyticus]|uniref:acyltransferase family protein n=1 Tax=Marinobacter caseinilyticus TaxID=2692195 RepID=UPI00140CB2A7|nr:acyltransferase [Marinobacter caseinilyticus]